MAYCRGGGVKNIPIDVRIIIGCDEVAEIIDKTGRDKEEKELIEEIIRYLSKIARQGRAMGIHLIMAPQRPDAQVCPDKSALTLAVGFVVVQIPFCHKLFWITETPIN